MADLIKILHEGERTNSGFIVFLTNNEYCDSATTPLTRAPREGQGPSNIYSQDLYLFGKYCVAVSLDICP